MTFSNAPHRTGANLKPIMFLHLLRRPRKGFLRAQIGYPTFKQQRVPTTSHPRRFAEGSADTMRRTEDLLLNRYLPERRRPVEFFASSAESVGLGHILCAVTL